jgi:hypothetical protein
MLPITSASMPELKDVCRARSEAESVLLAVVNQGIKHFPPRLKILSRPSLLKKLGIVMYLHIRQLA